MTLLCHFNVVFIIYDNKIQVNLILTLMTYMFWINTGKIYLIMSFVGMYHYYTDKILSQLAAVLLHIIDILLMWIVVHLFPSHVEHLHTFSEKVLIFVIGGGKGSNQRMPYII